MTYLKLQNRKISVGDSFDELTRFHFSEREILGDSSYEDISSYTPTFSVEIKQNVFENKIENLL